MNDKYSAVTSFKFIIFLLFGFFEILLSITSTSKPHRALFRMLSYHNSFLVALNNLHLNLEPPARDAYGRLDMDTTLANRDLYTFYCVELYYFYI
jgi:hypothetical protein